MLKLGFESLGPTGKWNREDRSTNLMDSKLVYSYIAKIRQDQAKAGVT